MPKTEWKFGDVITKKDDGVFAMVIGYSLGQPNGEVWCEVIGLSADHKGWSGYAQGEVDSAFMDWWTAVD